MESVNELFGLPAVDCLEPSAGILEMITAKVQVAYEFFDADLYQDHESNPYAYDVQETGLSAAIAQVKEFSVAMNSITFKNNFFTNSYPNSGH